MNLLEIIGGRYRRAGSKNGGEYQGACPWCGDGGKGLASDRFHIWPGQGRGGTYWCRACKRAGDAIKYLVDHDGLQFKDALDRLGLNPDILGPRKDKVPRGWQPAAATGPAEVWAEHAAKFAKWCHERLLERTQELCWLEKRGIDLEAVKKFRLGWNPTHAWRERPAWGLAPEFKADGKPKKLWLPRGLVIPLLAGDGRVLRLRIRQPDGEPRYFMVPGSSREPLCTRAADGLVVVESELDAITLDCMAGDLAGVVAMGNDSAKPTAALAPILRQAMHIAVALDSDKPKYNPETGRVEMAGAKSSTWWLEQFPQARRLPMVGGKDPGEAFKAGICLRTWVLAGLPPYFLVKDELLAEKERLRRERQRQAEEDEAKAVEKKVPEVIEEVVATPTPQSESRPVEEERPSDGAGVQPGAVREIVLADGRSFLVTRDQAEWERLTAEGYVVFSENELKRLQEACRTMTREERLAAAMLVLEVKEVFGNAWIKRGEAL